MDETSGLKKLSLGFIGIRLFFVISGYLISRILLTEKKEILQKVTSPKRALRQFYARRFLRIFPPYYLLLLILAAAGTTEFLQYWPWHTFYMSNFLLVRANGWIGLLSHFWSLSVEEQFYFFWPLLIFLTPWRWLGALCVVMMAIAPASRGILASQGLSGVAVRSFTLSCLDSLGAGAFLAYLEMSKPRAIRSFAWIALTLGGVLLSISVLVKLSTGSWIVRAVLFDLSAALILVWAVTQAKDEKLPRVLNNSYLGYIGKISYGVYLFHPLLPHAAERLAAYFSTPVFPPFGTLRFVVLTATSIGLASVSWYLFEKPINGLKKYFPY
jgi:peptidoglycan/LPS O-acetylase OafA/YrhL